MWKLKPPYMAICVVYCLAAVVKSAELETFSEEFGPFGETYYNIFEVIGSATISNGALQLTPDSAIYFIIPLSHNSGRIMLRQPFKLWDDDANSASSSTRPNLASFNISFLFNIYKPLNGTTATGLAFVIAPDLLVPPKSFGPFLGLTNSSNDGNRSNKLVAVEFDAFKDYFDPDDNHVGINVNSIISIKNASMTPHKITIAPKGVGYCNAWVDYDGLNKVMDVYIAEQDTETGATPSKPGSPMLSADLNLRDHVNQFSYFGFSASTGSDPVLNAVLRWNLTIHHFSDPDHGKMSGKWPWKLVIAVVLAVVVVVVIAAMSGYYFRKHKMASSRHNLVSALRCLPGTPKEFRFQALKKATNNFDEKNKLGQGGFGVVYKGVLVKDDVEIAVKWFSRESIKGQLDFLAELTIINRLSHKHLVKLLGWCHKNGKLLLVYEFMPNGSLDQHLFIGSNKEPLQWVLRCKIILGVASALHYLHNEYDQRVVHRDLKASNIMLDSEFNARLGDFGLARALDNGKNSYEAEGVIGTIGYIAPECFLIGKATRQSDIYAFGAVLLEVVCGQRPGTRIAGFQFLVDWVWMLHRDGKLLDRIAGFQFLVDWVWMLHRDGKLLDAVDQRLGDNYVGEEANRLLLLGLACSNPNASERPKAEDILQIISGTMPMPVVSPYKPAFVWAADGATDMDIAHANEVMDMNSVNTMSITISDYETYMIYGLVL